MADSESAAVLEGVGMWVGRSGGSANDDTHTHIHTHTVTHTHTHTHTNVKAHIYLHKNPKPKPYTLYRLLVTAYGRLVLAQVAVCRAHIIH
jgi:hypothetical protein